MVSFFLALAAASCGFARRSGCIIRLVETIRRICVGQNGLSREHTQAGPEEAKGDGFSLLIMGPLGTSWRRPK